ncbi:MAG: DEAD/DEAH box helicase family protein [Candidatus Coprenecus sp.]|nr:DEAD/DEAH box helicase family protein [Candidatus Coprenecus sp.]
MDAISNSIKQRMSLREPLAEALDVVTRLTEKLALKKPEIESEYSEYLEQQLTLAKEVCPFIKSFERDFPSFAFSIATGIGKTRLMGACIAYLYLKKGIKHFFVLAPNLTLYEKLKRDFGDPSYEKYVFKGIAEFAANPPAVIDGDNYSNYSGFGYGNLYNRVEINVFNISKFNSDSKESKKGMPRMKRLSEYIGKSYFEYLSNLEDLVILMDEAHRYHADASKRAIDELHPILGLEMTATPTDEKGKSFKNIVYEYNLAQALADGKYVKIPTIAKRRNFQRGGLSEREVDMIKLEDAISIHEHTKAHLELYSRQNKLPLVKPFILVICKNIGHATDTLHMIEDELFGGRYKGKVLQIDSSTKKDEEIDQLFVSLEKPENKIEVVIHVNMLKEGWDVTNLYTIVPLRAADAPILVEQSIGRGLRLPYGGKRTGYPDVDKLTVIAHDNFEAVIAAAKDPNSVLSKLSYIELDEDELTPEKSEVIVTQTFFDIQEKKELEKAKTEIEKKSAQEVADAKRAIWEVLGDMPRVTSGLLRDSGIKTVKDLDKPEYIAVIKDLTKRRIEASAREVSPMFAEEFSKPRIEEVDAVVETVIHDFVKNIIEIPRMTIQREAYKAEYKWFDLDTRMGFDLPSLKDEIIRVGLVDKSSDIIEVMSGRQYDSPLDQIVSALLDYDEIDYDENAELIYHLANQALQAITKNAENEDDIPKIVNNFKKAIAKTIFDQMQAHFVMTSLGYTKPKVLPFSGIEEQHATLVDGYGRQDYRAVVPPKFVPKIVFTGFTKSYYVECKFDSKTEQDFSNVLEDDPEVLKWLRPASNQFNIYWSNGSKKYEPDFVVETADAIYMVETKAKKNMQDADVLGKKKAAEEYCKNASEFTKTVGGKPWKYVLLAHDTVDRAASFKYLTALG